jgi:hypothetical protein
MPPRFACNEFLGVDLQLMPPEQDLQMVKHCNCGKSYTKAMWKKLKLTTKHGGRVTYADGHTYEFRHCAGCLSTLALTVRYPTSPPPPAPAPRFPVRPSSPPPQDIAASAMLRVSSRDK